MTKPPTDSMPTKGILRRAKGGAGVLLDTARPGYEVWVPAQLVHKYRLVEGATVAGPVRDARQGPQLVDVTSVCGLSPEAYQQRTPFRQLIAIDPDQRFDLADSSREFRPLSQILLQLRTDGCVPLPQPILFRFQLFPVRLEALNLVSKLRRTPHEI